MGVSFDREDEQTPIEACVPQWHTHTHACKRGPTGRSPDRLAGLAARVLRRRVACTECGTLNKIEWPSVGLTKSQADGEIDH
jgi:hypothetical protein